MSKRRRRTQRAYLCERLESRRLLAATLVSNTTTSGVIDTPGKQDSYEFTAAAGDRIILSVGEGQLATASFEPQLQLIGTTGTVLATNSAATTAFIEMAAPTSGTYGVVVKEAQNNTTGDYRLHFVRLPNPGAATDPADGDGKLLTPNSTTAAAIGTVGDIDLYSFTASVGDRIILSLGEGAAATTGFDPYLGLYGPNGAQLTTNSTASEAFIEVTAASAGTYGVLVRENNNNATGDYRLHFERLPFAGDATDPADGDGKALVSNTTTSAAIATVGDLDLYTFTAAVGDRIVLSVGDGTTTAADFDPYLGLYGPNGAQVTFNTTATEAFIEVTATTAGTYGVLVRENNNNSTGDYRLYFEKMPFPGNATDPADGDGRALVSNTTVSAAIGTIGDLDLYTFTAAVGDRFILSMGDGPSTNAAFDPYLAVYTPTGTQLTPSTSATSAYIEMTASTAGTYTVLARENNNNTTGDYRLHFIKLPFAGNPTDPADGDGRTLVSNTTVSAAIGSLGDLDLYAVTVAIGDSFEVTVGDTSGNTFAPRIAVYQPTGGLVASDAGVASASADVLSVSAAGTYWVLVADNTGVSTGNYAVHFVKSGVAQPVDPIDGDGGALVSGSSTSASVTIGDLDVYTLALAAGGSATIRVAELGATAFAPQIDVFGPTGARVGSNAGQASAIVTLTNVPAAGTYVVVVRESGDDSIGQYALAVDGTPGTDARPPTIVDQRFDYNTDRPQVVMTLSEGIGGTLDATDLVLQNLTTGTTVPGALISATFNTLSNEVVFRFPGYAGGVLPDGNYRATLGAGTLSDTAGNPLAASSPLDFFALAGDANRDRKVDFADLVVLAQNYNTQGRTFVLGDFSYDGIVDFNDLVLLAQRYNTSLPAPTGAVGVAAPAATASASSKESKVGAFFSVIPVRRPPAVKPKAPVVRHR